MDGIKIRRATARDEADYSTWNMSVVDYTASANVIVQEGAFAVSVINIGDTMARINGILLFPSTTPLLSRGDSFVFGAHKFEVYKGNLTLSFDVAGSVFPVGVAPHVQIIQEFYSKF
jgi:hypothetical protein